MPRSGRCFQLGLQFANDIAAHAKTHLPNLEGDHTVLRSTKICVGCTRTRGSQGAERTEHSSPFFSSSHLSDLLFSSLIGYLPFSICQQAFSQDSVCAGYRPSPDNPGESFCSTAKLPPMIGLRRLDAGTNASPPPLASAPRCIASAFLRIPVDQHNDFLF